MVQSYSGYNCATGWVQLPSVYCAPGTTDTAYEIVGFHTATSDADTGIFSHDGITWYTAINMGGVNWDPKSAWWIGETDEPIAAADHPVVYIVSEVLDTGVQIKVCDGVTYQLLASQYGSGPNRGFNRQGTGVTVVREHSLAYIQGTGNLSSGSYVHGSRWYDVWIYWNGSSQYSQWTSNHTKAVTIGDTADEARTVTVSGVTRDYADTCNIDFNLP